jgi:hypothetical protein
MLVPFLFGVGRSWRTAKEETTKHSRNIDEISPTLRQIITSTSPKHHQIIAKTS